MMRVRKWVRCTLAVAAFAGCLLPIDCGSAAAEELRFTETQMPLGTTASVVDLFGGEYAAFGIDVTNAYRYHDDRDPFSDGVENQGSNPYGISLDDRGSVARVDFLTPVSNLEIDWWTINATMNINVFDTAGTNIYSVAGMSETGETELINAPNISYFEFFDGGGVVQVSNIRFNQIPEPATTMLAASGLLAFGWLRRRAA